MKSRIWIALLLIAIPIQLSMAQDPELIMDNIYPPSPEASALGKYGEYPVSLYTGIPSISIPIWEIETKQIQVPISISYHASGIKIDEIATNVGLGWALNAGGVITRSVRGLADDALGGFYNTTFTSSTITTGANVMNISDGLKDGETDIYYFNFCGYSGSFHFDLDQNIILSEKQDLIIEVNEDGGFIEFIITMSDGVKYYFGNSCLDCTGEDYREESKITSEDHMNNELYNSTWYLRKIESLNNEDVNFYYDAIGSSDQLQTIQHTIALNAEAFTVIANDERISYSYTLNQKRLDSIEYDGGVIVFNHNTTREDINSGKSLDLIEIKDPDYKKIRSFKLVHSYYDYNYNYRYAKRLRLDSIIELGEDDVLKRPYAFEYYEDYTMPPRRSYWNPGTPVYANSYFSQDHWGYFNGESNTQLIPDFSYGGNSYNGANREPQWPYTKTNILEKITYPTGGYTMFEFEPNYIGYEGADTVHGYYEDVTLYDYNDHCDTIQTTYAYSDLFEIEDSEHGLVEVSLTLDKFNCSDTSTNPALILAIYDNNNGNPVLDTSWTLNSNPPYSSALLSGDYQMDAGEYYLKISYSRYSEFWWSFDYEKYFDEDQIFERDYDEFGGLRIKKIENYDNNDSKELSKEYKYLTNLNSGESSGQPINKPSYYELRQKTSLYPLGSGEVEMLLYGEHIRTTLFSNTFFSAEGRDPHCVGILVTTGEVILNSSPTYELGKIQGGLVGYASVFELNSNGGTCSIFSSVDEIPEQQFRYYKAFPSGGQIGTSFISFGDNSIFPYPPVINLDMFRGKLLGKIYFDDENNTVLKEEYEYAAIDYDSCISVKASPDLIVSSGNIIGSDQMTKFVTYFALSTHHPLILKRDISYSDGDSTTVSFTKYEYPDSDHYQLKEEKQYTSSGDSLRILYFYPYDSEVNTYANFAALKDSNLVQVPLRVDQYLNTTLTGRSANRFNSDLLIDSVDSYDFDESDFRTLKEFKEYDDANLLEFKDADGVISSVIWGYGVQYPVVIAQNVSRSVLISAVSSSLPTGYATLQDLLDDVSDDPESHSDWQAFNEDLRSVSTLADATITTYCVQPLVGVVGKTDPGGISVYYEYDGLGRLKLVRDNDGNIIQENEYNYAH